MVPGTGTLDVVIPSLARSLTLDPDLFLFDEPFGALDALTREQITADTEQIWMNKGFGALLITHSISEAVFLADRAVVVLGIGVPEGRLVGAPSRGVVAGVMQPGLEADARVG
mgnify:CR=1 FL=1